MSFQLNRLTATVNAVNRANAYANKIAPQLRKIFLPYIGQKIMKLTGDLAVKYKNLLPDLSNTLSLRIYKTSSDYSLSWSITTCENILENDSCVYYETSIYIGSLLNCVLTNIEEQIPERRTDYTVEEILQKREKYKDAKARADLALSDLQPFGEYDR